jgi:uncharacterized protein
MPKGVPTGPEPLDGLRVDVAALRRRGADRERISTELPTRWLAAVLEGTDAEVTVAGRVELEILLPVDGAVIANGRLTVAFSVPCGRCLEPAAVDGGADVGATYVVGTQLPKPSGIAGEDEDEEGLGLSDDDLDTWLYDGSILVLDELIAEQVKLAYPMRALCVHGEDCRGLCSNCGHDLNTQPGTVEDRGLCSNCGKPTGAVAGDPENAQNADPDAEGPLAEALRKLQLPD